jgi:hypothetical protein
MKKSIGRPARALLPLALGALVHTGDGARAAALAFSILAAQLFSLGAGAAFQAASGKLVSEARLRGNFLTSLILALAGGGLTAWALPKLHPLWLGFPEVSLWMALSGAMVMLTELFSNRLYALTDKLSAPFCDALTAALVAAGLISSRGDDQILFWFTLAALAASLVVGFGIGGFARLRLGARVLAEVPRSLVRAWLPAAAFVGFLLIGRDLPLGAFAAAGWALFSWAYAPNRRTEEESGPVTILTTLAASAAVLVALARPVLWGLSAMALFLPVYFACLATAYLTSTPGARAALSLLSYTLATAAMGWHLTDALFFGVPHILPYLAAGAAALAVSLVVPDVASALRLARARLKFRGRKAQGRPGIWD